MPSGSSINILRVDQSDHVHLSLSKDNEDYLRLANGAELTEPIHMTNADGKAHYTATFAKELVAAIQSDEFKVDIVF